MRDHPQPEAATSPPPLSLQARRHYGAAHLLGPRLFTTLVPDMHHFNVRGS
ncbi:hypothetical protein [Thermobifida fusca]|uniref:hypothetical protein n=1 Tax=Thermobifida fusca TaxID=2021 RepID=UPI001878C852|nr:hypothetical protein [Thermobifida fusca]QOS59649.1 hypothetical protein IM867_04405 [Thermobifida fusca]